MTQAHQPESRSSVCDLARSDLEALVVELGDGPDRARQVWRAVHHELRESFDEMAFLSTPVREGLKERFAIGLLETAYYATSDDGTVDKALFRLADGELIETVLMRYAADGHRRVRRTVCVSTQAGCAWGCTFCATGQQGFKRHLSVGEIVSQVLFMERIARAEDEEPHGGRRRSAGQRRGVTNVVYMGMGEPLANYDNTLGSIRTLIDEQGLHIGIRHVTLSTVGLVPQIMELANEGLPLNLAVSLHAASNATRSETMPVNRRYPLEQLVEACRSYIKKTGRRIFFEYVLLHGQNDSVAQAEALGRLLKGVPCHVNLIPVNPTDAGLFQRPSPVCRVAFQQKLRDYGVPSTIRMEKGIDINAGCGQLRARVVGTT